MCKCFNFYLFNSILYLAPLDHGVPIPLILYSTYIPYITTNMSSTDHGGWKAYEYNPSMAAAVIFIILYIVVTALHTYNLFRTRTWFFIPLVLGGYCMSPSLLSSNFLL